MPLRVLSLLAVFSLALLSPLTAAFAAHHEEAEAAAAAGFPEWDQEKMTELTARLATEMSELRTAMRKSPRLRNPDNPNRRAADQMLETMRQLDRTASSFATRVSRGQGREETEGITRRIASLLNDADNLSRRLLNDASVDARVRPAMQTINEIAAFYHVPPLYDVETMTRLDASAPNPTRRQQSENAEPAAEAETPSE